MTKPLVQNAADPAQVRKAAVREQLANEQQALDLRSIMEQEGGRRYLWRLLDTAGVFRTSFTGNSETFFREGMRNVGLIIMADLQDACPDLYQRMVNENRLPRQQQKQRST